MPGPLAYVAAFVGSLVLCWTITPLMLRVAVRRHVLDAPDDRKAQASPVPYLGGVAMVLAFAAALVAAALAYRPDGVGADLAVVVGVGGLLAVVGLVDDLRGLSPWLRLAVEAGAGVAVWGIGNGVDLPGPTGTDVLVTIVWVVGVTNALNLLDNMDGLSAGVATIAAGAFFVLAVVNGQYLIAALAAAVGGCAAGFLRHNFHPAKIYMGDAGSLFLGYLLAFLGIRLKLSHTPQAVALFVPIVVLGVPLFDTLLVSVNRLRHGRTIFTPGRDHTSHRLVAIGMSVPVAVGLIYAAGVILGWLAVILARLDLVSGMLLISLVLAAGVALLVLMSAVPVYENSRQRRSMLQVVRQHEREAPEEKPVLEPKAVPHG